MLGNVLDIYTSDDPLQPADAPTLWTLANEDGRMNIERRTSGMFSERRTEPVNTMRQTEWLFTVRQTTISQSKEKTSQVCSIKNRRRSHRKDK